jgi:protein involved in polysaccharide export with SLBB domain
MLLLELLTGAGAVASGSDARATAPWCQADLSAAYLIRGNERIPIDLRNLVQAGDLSANIPLKSGDTIVVPEAVSASSESGDSQIYLLGKFTKPGIYPIKQELPVLHALFLAGGLAPDADPRKAFLVRGETRTPIDVDRLLLEGDLTQNLMLRAGDTLTIPEGHGWPERLAEAQKRLDVLRKLYER